MDETNNLKEEIASSSKLHESISQQVIYPYVFSDWFTDLLIIKMIFTYCSEGHLET